IFTQNKAALVAIGRVYEAVNKKGPFQTLGVVGNKTWADNNGALARRVSFAIRAAARWANRNHGACAPLLAQYTKISPDVIAAYPRIAFAESNSSTLLQPVVDMLTRFAFLPRGFAEKLLEIDAVTEAYSVAGDYDIVAIVRVREHEMLSDVVSERIARLSGIIGTQTLIAFRAYSRRDLGQLWDVGAT